METESFDVWVERTTELINREEEEYELYGQFYVFKNKIQDDRPSTIIPRQPLPGLVKKTDVVIQENQTIQDLEGYLDESKDSEQQEVW